MPEIVNNGLDLSKEEIERDGSEFRFGAASPICIASIPIGDREQYLPQGELQRGVEDFMDCVTRGVVNIMETKFTYLYRTNKLNPLNKLWLEQNGYLQGDRITFSDRFIAMKSGTTRTGNSMKAPASAIHTYGLIPKALLPALNTMTFDQYHDKTAITDQMVGLGEEFNRRFVVNYEQVYLTDLEEVLGHDMVNLAGYAWPNPVNDEYPAQAHAAFNHAFMGYKTPKSYIFDNYLDNGKTGDWIKKLAADYVFYEYGYRLFISAEIAPKTQDEIIKDTVHEVFEKQGLMKWWGLFLQLFYSTPEPVPPPVGVPNPAVALRDAARSYLGKDASPKNLAPKEVSCAEGVSNIVHSVFPDFPADIVGTDQLFTALKKSKRFKGVLNPEEGCIEISPRTATVNGHCGIYVKPDSIASNDSRNGLFQENYTRLSWRKTFIQGRGLKAYLFVPV